MRPTSLPSHRLGGAPGAYLQTDYRSLEGQVQDKVVAAINNLDFQFLDFLPLQQWSPFHQSSHEGRDILEWMSYVSIAVTVLDELMLKYPGDDHLLLESIRRVLISRSTFSGLISLGGVFRGRRHWRKVIVSDLVKQQGDEGLTLWVREILPPLLDFAREVYHKLNQSRKRPRSDEPLCDDENPAEEHPSELTKSLPLQHSTDSATGPLLPQDFRFTYLHPLTLPGPRAPGKSSVSDDPAKNLAPLMRDKEFDSTPRLFTSNGLLMNSKMYPFLSRGRSVFGLEIPQTDGGQNTMPEQPSMLASEHQGVSGFPTLTPIHLCFNSANAVPEGLSHPNPTAQRQGVPASSQGGRSKNPKPQQRYRLVPSSTSTPINVCAPSLHVPLNAKPRQPLMLPEKPAFPHGFSTGIPNRLDVSSKSNSRDPNPMSLLWGALTSSQSGVNANPKSRMTKTSNKNYRPGPPSFVSISIAPPTPNPVPASSCSLRSMSTTALPPCPLPSKPTHIREPPAPSHSDSADDFLRSLLVSLQTCAPYSAPFDPQFMRRGEDGSTLIATTPIDFSALATGGTSSDHGEMHGGETLPLVNPPLHWPPKQTSMTQFHLRTHTISSGNGSGVDVSLPSPVIT